MESLCGVGRSWEPIKQGKQGAELTEEPDPFYPRNSVMTDKGPGLLFRKVQLLLW